MSGNIQKKLELCYILLLHRTTTQIAAHFGVVCCVISYFYIEPQLAISEYGPTTRCVISYFYIEPQLIVTESRIIGVVLYLTSTSNHNPWSHGHGRNQVVLYLTSTSNHNWFREPWRAGRLCYILLLHQTTTRGPFRCSIYGCVISYFYIKPQQVLWIKFSQTSCVISYFYIKPQLLARH